MEKRDQLSLLSDPGTEFRLVAEHTSKSKFTRRRVTVIVGALCFSAGLVYFSGQSPNSVAVLSGSQAPCGDLQNSSKEFLWENVKPSAQLEWVDCYDKFKCSKLTVPLDYHDKKAGKVSIAMLKIPSAFPSTSEEYRGPVLINPGGPGGSGVSLAKGRGELLQGIVGKGYDIIGFDPRGTGQTSPPLSFFPSAAARIQWNLKNGPLVNSTEGALSMAYSRAQVLGDIAEANARNASQYISTASVATDMLSIMKAHGRDKLLYWGFSYGSVLGATYAAMYPDNIERLVIDGVMDADEYYSARWITNLVDTDKTLTAFFTGCFSAGPSGCPFHAPSPQLIASRLDALYASVKARPVPVFTSLGYGVVDYSMLRQLIFTSLYSPYNSYPQLADALAALEKNDGGPLLGLYARSEEKLECDCPRTPVPELPLSYDAALGIRCTDGVPVEDDVEELQAHFEKLGKLSSFADVWAGFHLACAGWKVRPKWRFEGPFVGNTSFPILLVGNTADPVTPLSHAFGMSKKFKDASVLIQNSLGHCSLSAVSICTMRHIRAYFNDGVVPINGTVCEVQSKLFARGSDKDILETLSAEDAELFKVTKELSEGFQVRFPY
ncbi:hypothetical protein BOTBODRAFT_153690 [Botryobasidium botryosum FD-172 SS1]|uniref:AB hydrolase-1 domain-containing protein n=1 Tax=Botryobasidium botryosum (strain FD-172 SS1) TaxID=930990 RepID=A0A067N4V9_BOTB1|nr:hypothetical protein BOTBODRAFT_153690 [Botryobasidium botryosum FD-172 SS1]